MTIYYYAEAREIARRLDEGGHTNEARSLIEAIETGATGTEILMALRCNLQRLEKANLPMNIEIRTQIRDLITAISEVLGG
ncbi:MAG: hypothetical protein KIS78_02380 [Labilithrix sp.]|nr:hypothetical protein [Labilithrix sp.]